MKKILCFIDCLSSGGAQRQMVELTKILKEHNYQVKIIVYYNIPFYYNELIKNNIEYEYIKNANSLWKRIPVILNFFRHYNPDIVISYLDIPCIIACIGKLIGLKYKLIVSERNTTQQITFTDKIKFFLYQFADVIVPNSYSQEYFINKHYPSLSNKISTITNMVDTNYFSPTKKSVQSEVTEIIGVGRIDNQKNILALLDAISQLASKGYQFHFTWFGQIFPDYYKKCTEKIQILNLSNHFEFKEPTTDIKTEYLKADAFCLPSIYEGFPNVLCEAMSCGLPVICSNICDNPYIVNDNGFLFSPNNTKDIVSAFERFLTLSNEEKAKMSSKSRQIAVKLFSKKTFANKYFKLLND